jgi:hypothetical protein
LQEKIDEILASPALERLLRGAGIQIADAGKHKQTDTTQRWKPMLLAEGREEPVRTRIEFSHRGTDPRRKLDPVPDRIVAPYALRAPALLHYTADAAIEQKVRALGERSQTQARDVFDLELLLRRHRDAPKPGDIEPAMAERALARVSELSIEAFEDQVLPFLDSEVADLYRSPDAWDRIQTFVSDRLMEFQ